VSLSKKPSSSQPQRTDRAAPPVSYTVVSRQKRRPGEPAPVRERTKDRAEGPVMGAVVGLRGALYLAAGAWS
jgi:hypothetical protein